jgi:hypothetical protein
MRRGRAARGDGGDHLGTGAVDEVLGGGRGGVAVLNAGVAARRRRGVPTGRTEGKKRYAPCAGLGGGLQERCERLVEFGGEMFASMKRQLSGAELSAAEG